MEHMPDNEQFTFQEWPADDGAGPSTAGVGADLQDGGDGTGGGGGNIGGSGDPIPLMHMQHERKETIYTCKAAGTTFVRAANNGSADNLWTNFPWEFPRLFLSSDQTNQMYFKALYWKAEHVMITFKNPLCIQELGTGANGITQSGTNAQAQLFGYSDVNYLTAINDKPGPHGNNFVGTEYSAWMQSWRQHGYFNNAPQPLPQVDIPDNLFTSIDPDVKEIGMGPGKSMAFGWRIKNDYWRGTSEFPNSGPETNRERVPRWDPYMGYILNFNAIGVAPGASQQEISYVSPAQAITRGGPPGQTMTEVVSGASGETTLTFPHVVTYACAEPMPKLWLQLQPQLSSLTAGTGNSTCQLQWEMSVRMRLTGQVPRRNRIQTWGNVGDAYDTEYGLGRLGRQTIPIFKPAMSTYNATIA